MMTASSIRIFLCALTVLLTTTAWLPANSASIKGKVTDENYEGLVGAYILVRGQTQYAVAGLDGSFSIPKLDAGNYTLEVSFIGFKTIEKEVTITSSDEVISVAFTMEPDASQLGDVVVTASAEVGSDAQARLLERTSPNMMNVLSAKSISLSPDISVANVVQRVSGLTIERSSNGDPQYAIVRGMDKRYSYTLVNGVKIPSPDNKNRYVPLDIFPATLLERLEVYKSLTADMEGDAMGGAINLVMKGAAETNEIKGDLQVGYNYINVLDGFDKFNAKVVRDKSPREIYGPAYQAQPGDFTKKNGNTENINPLPDILASLSATHRFLHDRLGVMIGGSFQNSYRGSESLWFETETDRYGSNRPAISNLEDRHYSVGQLRAAMHTKLDFRFNEHHNINLYTGYYILNNQEARETNTTYLDGRAFNSSDGNAILAYSTRTRLIKQSILNNTLQGQHRIAKPVTVDWSLVASSASNDRPDNLRFDRNGELRNFEAQPINVERRSPRQWERNSDRDYAGYLNFTIRPWEESSFTIKTGGMYRDRKRTNYFNRYLFDPDPTPQIQGDDWNKFSDVTWDVVNPSGSATNELNYKAKENILAYYLLTKFQIEKTDINAGVRVEHTDQGYTLLFPNVDQTPDSTQTYTDILPSVSVRHRLNDRMNLRLNYYAAIARPGFFEIVPYVNEQDGFDEAGNKNLRRAKGQNIDLRWEYFTSVSNQLLVGVFYKALKDPIEYGVLLDGVNNEQIIIPGNYGTAYNLGLELDFTKFFNRIGVRGNYTYTRSRITTDKIVNTRVDPNDPSSDLIAVSVRQTRPLQGQANHIGNLSLLYKDLKQGTEAQLSMVFTGERLESISPYLNNDTYVTPVVQLDLSAEKRISSRLDVFIKATNLLNSPYKTFIKQPIYKAEGDNNVYPHQSDPEHKTLIRRDQYFQSVRVGIRIQFINRS